MNRMSEGNTFYGRKAEITSTVVMMRNPRGSRRTTALAVLLGLACLAHTAAFM